MELRSFPMGQAHAEPMRRPAASNSVGDDRCDNKQWASLSTPDRQPQ